MTLNQSTMQAVRLLRCQSEPELVTIPVPEPGPGEVLRRAPSRLRSTWPRPRRSGGKSAGDGLLDQIRDRIGAVRESRLGQAVACVGSG